MNVFQLRNSRKNNKHQVKFCRKKPIQLSCQLMTVVNRKRKCTLVDYVHHITSNIVISHTLLVTHLLDGDPHPHKKNQQSFIAVVSYIIYYLFIM